MSTLLPVTCYESWTLVYDGSISGNFSGSLQSSGLGVMRVDVGLPTVDTGFLTHDLPTSLVISNTEKLYVRASYGSIVVQLG